MLKSPLSARPVIEALEARIAPATFTVTTTADSGPGSLRQAILDANVLEGADTIGFDIAGNQLQVIALTSPLPAITETLTISTLSSSGQSLEVVRLDGTGAGPDANGLQFVGTSGSVIAGLEIGNFSGSGVMIDAGTGNIIQHNNIFRNGEHGIHVTGGSLNRVVFQNSIYNNSGDGIRVDNSPGVTIGLQSTGGSGNYIERNGGWGVSLVNQSGSANVVANTIQENSVGGILVDTSSFITIGGATSNSNVIAKNSGAGVAIKNSFAVKVAENSFKQSFPVDLGGDGPTPNDAGDTDTGVNGLLNFPSVTASLRSDGWTNVYGTFETDKPNHQFRLQFYAIDPADSNHKLVESRDVTTDNSGRVQISAVIYSLLSIGRAARELSVVATDLTTGDSSEFSPRVHVNSIVSGSYLEVNEGNAGENTGSLTLKLNWAESTPVTVHYRTVDGTAKAGEDYQSLEGTVTFAPGETTKSIPLTWFGDTVEETTERFYFDFSDVQGASIEAVEGAGKATITLKNDDAIPVISSYGATVIEGGSGPGNPTLVQFTVSLDKPSLDPINVFIDFSGSANASISSPGNPQDYTYSASHITFAPGETSYTGTVTIFDDTVAEPKEAILLRLSFDYDSGPATIGSQGVITILDNDLWQLKASPVEFTEGNDGQTLAVLTVYVDPLGPGLIREHPVTVHYSTVSENRAGEASPGTDYQAVEGTLTFAPGENSKTISIPITGDTVAEASEFIEVAFSQLSGAVLVTPRAKITVNNDDLPTLSVSGSSILEGNSGEKLLVFTAVLSNSVANAITVDYTTADDTATAGSDYTAASGTLTFAPGETTKTVSVPVHGDTVQEANETLRLLLSNASGASLATAEVHGVIADDDSPESLPELSVANASVTEGHSGTSSLVFTFNLSKASASAVSVQYSTADNTATAGSDYAAVSGTLTFAPGETTKTVSVPVQGDTVNEANETLRLLLSGMTGATLVQDETTGTILNDDVSSDAANLIISKGGRKATWIDSDGDLVTLVATKPVLTLSSFHFGSADGSDNLVLEQLDAAFQGNAKALGLSFSVKKSATGDGLVNVGEIDASGRDLTTISLPGRLGAILAGDTNLKTPAIRKLTVNSFGMYSATAQAGVAPLLSEVKGSIGSFAVKHDFTGANLIVSGGSVQSLVIGGELEGISSEAPSGISIEKNLSNLKVGGDVSHTNVLAGTGTQAGAHVGQVLVKGNWSASNLAVGAGAGPDGYFGTQDDIALQDTASRIARITIRGAVFGTSEAESATDHYGFVAGRIAAFQVGAQKFVLSSKWREMGSIGTTPEEVTLCELAGPSHP